MAGSSNAKTVSHRWRPLAGASGEVEGPCGTRIVVRCVHGGVHVVSTSDHRYIAGHEIVFP
jgi:hypothetical protein